MQTCHIEQVVGQFNETLGGLIDPLQCFGLPINQGWSLATFRLNDERLGEAFEDSQWGAQFMGSNPNIGVGGGGRGGFGASKPEQVR